MYITRKQARTILEENYPHRTQAIEAYLDGLFGPRPDDKQHIGIFLQQGFMYFSESLLNAT